MKWKAILAVVLLLPVLGAATLAILSFRAGGRPRTLGLQDGKLHPCGDTPNCISSKSTASNQWMEPIPLTIEPARALELLKTVICTMPRAQIVTADDQYLHAEFESALFRFVDDLEFVIKADENLIHFRSQSRVGYSDFGVNRRRMQSIIHAYQREASRLARAPNNDR